MNALILEASSPRNSAASNRSRLPGAVNRRLSGIPRARPARNASASGRNYKARGASSGHDKVTAAASLRDDMQVDKLS